MCPLVPSAVNRFAFLISEPSHDSLAGRRCLVSHTTRRPGGEAARHAGGLLHVALRHRDGCVAGRQAGRLRALATWAEFDDTRKSDLWLLDLGTKASTRLTFDRANDHKLRWSADGKFVYALGSRHRAGETNPPFDGKSQVCRIPVDGGPPTAVTQANAGVSGYDLAAKAGALFYSTDTTQRDDDEFAKLRAKFDGVEYGHGVRAVSELHKLDLESFRDEVLKTDTRYIREFAVTADGKRVAMVTAFDDTVVKSEGESRVDVWEGGKTVTPPTEVYRARHRRRTPGSKGWRGRQTGRSLPSSPFTTPTRPR